ncbi:NADH/ubiquinone/plastoquinone (complex I) [Marinilabiliaceae bacterium JC017]|nr:NADH/ubiquinone/plastoquinone (complex I) [Marinilabiliaceae bacterium JC017]
MESFLPLYMVTPLAAAFLIPLVGRVFSAFARTITPLVFLLLLILGIHYLLSGISSPLTYEVGGWQPVNGIPIAIYLVLDGFSTILLITINLIAFLAAFYSISYMKKYTAENNYYTLFCLMVAGMNGVVLTGDLFNLYVFLEIAAISSYALVAFGVEKTELEASFKYQVLGGMASLLILLAIGLLYWATSTLNITDISHILMIQGDNKIILFIQILLITGFGLKAAMVPFHAWLPDAHSSAPSPISAMLSGILIKAIGVYVLFRLLFNMFTLTYEIALTITVLAVLSMVIGGILAIGQQDYKRLLAYSSISQVGYILLAMGIGMMVLAQNGAKEIAALAILGGLFHLINHAVFKGLMFMNAGAVEHATGIRDLAKLGGLAKWLPLTSATSFTGSMAISGIPPFSGFFSKLIIIIAAIQANYYLLAFLAALVSIITLAYFLKLQKNIFYATFPEHIERVRKIPFTMKCSMVMLAILCLAMSLLIIPGIRDIVLIPAVEVLID